MPLCRAYIPHILTAMLTPQYPTTVTDRPVCYLILISRNFWIVYFAKSLK